MNPTRSPQYAIARPRIEFAQATDPGRDPNKQVNEDACGYAETKFGHLVVLCDGMGGHYGGKEASRTAITTIFEVIEQLPPATSPHDALQRAIEEAARRVYLLGGPPDNRTRPGSTVVALLLHDRLVEVAHVGDSRAHMIRAGQIYPITRDHSMIQGMIDAGVLTEEQAFGHPDANKITRALGMRPEVDVEVRPDPLEIFSGDLLLLSSDGLTDLALGHDILATTRQALSTGPLSHACASLVQLANDRGGHDNITVQVVRVLDVSTKALNTIPDEAPNSAGGMRLTEVMADPLQGLMSLHDGGAPFSAGHHAQSPPSTNRAPQPPPSGNGAPQFLGTPQAPLPVTPTATDVPPKVTPSAPLAPLSGSQPTITSRAPGSSTQTMTEHQDPAGSQWSSGMYTGPPPQRPAGTYAGELPSPPPIAPQPPGLTSYAAHVPPQGLEPMPMPMPMPFVPMPAPMVTPPAAPARSGMVFVIAGLVAVIALLVAMLIWALFFRV